MVKLPKNIKDKVKNAIFAKADKYGYARRSRNENGRFMDDLVEDPEIGHILKEYMSGERIRTYIKDGILNAYAKEKNKQTLALHDPITIIQQEYNIETVIIQKQGAVTVCRSSDNQMFVISQGTVLKWETALRKVLELVARTPNLCVNKKYPSICLQLAVINEDITEGDITQIKTALAAVSVQVSFCRGE
jgi:hypothetical protein